MTEPQWLEAKPRRAASHQHTWTNDLYLITLSMVAGFIGGFLGTVLGRAW